MLAKPARPEEESQLMGEEKKRKIQSLGKL